MYYVYACTMYYGTMYYGCYGCIDLLCTMVLWVHTAMVYDYGYILWLLIHTMSTCTMYYVIHRYYVLCIWYYVHVLCTVLCTYLWYCTMYYGTIVLCMNHSAMNTMVLCIVLWIRHEFILLCNYVLCTMYYDYYYSTMVL